MHREDVRTGRRKPCENTDIQREDGHRTTAAEIGVMKLCGKQA